MPSLNISSTLFLGYAPDWGSNDLADKEQLLQNGCLDKLLYSRRDTPFSQHTTSWYALLNRAMPYNRSFTHLSTWSAEPRMQPHHKLETSTQLRPWHCNRSPGCARPCFAAYSVVVGLCLPVSLISIDVARAMTKRRIELHSWSDIVTVHDHQFLVTALSSEITVS